MFISVTNKKVVSLHSSDEVEGLIKLNYPYSEIVKVDDDYDNGLIYTKEQLISRLRDHLANFRWKLTLNPLKYKGNLYLCNLDVANLMRARFDNYIRTPKSGTQTFEKIVEDYTSPVFVYKSVTSFVNMSLDDITNVAQMIEQTVQNFYSTEYEVIEKLKEFDTQTDIVGIYMYYTTKHSWYVHGEDKDYDFASLYPQRYLIPTSNTPTNS